MEAYIYITQKIRNQIMVMITVLMSVVIFLMILGNVQNRNLKMGLFIMGSISASLGLVANTGYHQISELLEDTEYVERENRLKRIAGLFNFSSDYTNKTEETPVEILEQPEDYLVSIALTSNHFRVCGESGSGKTTLVENLISCLVEAYPGKVDVIWTDPKYPFNHPPIEPQFKGIDEALDGLALLATTVETRLMIAKNAAKSNQSIPKFSPIVFVIDEIDWIVSEYGNQATQLLKVGLKVGRSLNVKVCYFGQTPLCSDLKLRRNDFKHSANFFLGENALAGINEVCYTTAQKRLLSGQISARIERGDEFFSLVKRPGKSPFTAILPQPQAYTTNKLEPLVSLDYSQVVSLADPGKSVKNPVLAATPETVEIDQIDSEDQTKLDQIKGLWDSGETRLTKIIPTVWGSNCTGGSRAYRKAREEYKRLTGK